MATFPSRFPEDLHKDDFEDPQTRTQVECALPAARVVSTYGGSVGWIRPAFWEKTHKGHMRLKLTVRDEFLHEHEVQKDGIQLPAGVDSKVMYSSPCNFILRATTTRPWR